MRRQRIAMVQTKEQYILVHRAVRDLFLDQLKVIDSHPYENLDINGRPRTDEKDEANYENIYVIAKGSKKEVGNDLTGKNESLVPPPLPERRRENFSPLMKSFSNSLECTPRHSRNNSVDSHSKSVSSVSPVNRTPGSSYEELTAIALKSEKNSGPEHADSQNVAQSFFRRNLLSSSPEPKHSRTKPSDIKAKAKGGKISAAIKRSKSLKVPSSISDIKVRPTSPVLERRYLVPDVSEVVPERVFVRPQPKDVSDSRFYVSLIKDSDAYESRDCEVETVSIRPVQMHCFPKQVSVPNLISARNKKISSVSPNLLRKPFEENVPTTKKKMSLSPFLSRKSSDLQSNEFATVSLERSREFRKSHSNLSEGSSHLAGLVGSIDRTSDSSKLLNGEKQSSDIKPLICHINTSTTFQANYKTPDVSKSRNAQKTQIPVKVTTNARKDDLGEGIMEEEKRDKDERRKKLGEEISVPVVLQVKYGSSPKSGNYDNVGDIFLKDPCLNDSKNPVSRYEKVWLSSDSEPLYANLPLKKSISMKDIKIQPELSVTENEYFVQKTDEITKLLKDLRCISEPTETPKTAPPQSLKPLDGPIRSKSEDYISSPPFREPPSYEAVISSKLYKEKLSRIADLADSKERQQRRLNRKENGPVAPPRARRNGSFNEHPTKTGVHSQG
ncbi:hypothetical protein QYM36_005800 [Artemia franciscana]|uniref:protein-tyrosine-phosphatase n=1 Tax=Artemia franciscana TaxID=6661 RepID=A0AA88HV23_ARTSF|nr:hypothetical protein QYM36_005800 [Artemia franciscana]